MTHISLRPSPILFTAALALLASLIGCAAQPNAAAPVEQLTQYSFWPDAPNEPHIQYLTSFNSSADVELKQKKTTGLDQMIYGDDRQQVLPIVKPYGVRMFNGCIYVCEIRTKGITILDLRNKQTRIMGATGKNALGKAVDLAISPEGYKYVVDTEKNAIVVFDQKDSYAGTFPLKDAAPVAATVWQNLLYVVDYKNAHVKVLDRSNGQLLRTFGERGGEDGQFIGAIAICTDKQGNIYVSDAIRAHVQKFSPEGKFLLGFGEPGDRPGNFIRPKHMGVGSDGRVHIVDAAYNNVQVFDPDGQVEGYYGTGGSFPGAMNLPAGLDVNETDLDLFQKFIHPAFQADRLIVVANQFGNQKISVYAMGHLKPGKTVADIAPARLQVESGTVVATTQPAAAATQPTATVTEQPAAAPAAQPAVVSTAPQQRP